MSNRLLYVARLSAGILMIPRAVHSLQATPPATGDAGGRILGTWQGVPVRALGGTLDTQVPGRENLSGIDAALEGAGNTDYRIVELPNLNHLFQTATNGSPSEYATIEETIAPQVLDLITSWINQGFGRGERR